MRITFDFFGDGLTTTVESREAETTYTGADAWRWLWMLEEGPQVLAERLRPDTEAECLEQVEAQHIKRILHRYPEENYEALAGRLGISNKTLWEKRRKYDINKPTASS